MQRSELRLSETSTRSGPLALWLVRLWYILALAVGSAFWAGAAVAHEYWVQVDQTGLSRGDTIELHVRVGQNLRGNEQIYYSRSIRAFKSVHDGDVADVETRDGDRPAGKISRVKSGLYVAALMTNANVLTYKEKEKFDSFARSHGNDFAIAQHSERGLPEVGFKESYFRFAKTLVKVGDGAGKDIATGMPYELVALNNPFTDPGPVRMMLMFSGKPVPDHHVDIFFRADGAKDAVKTVVRTNALGELEFETEPGLYLVNAVRLELPNDRIVEALGVAWQSLWASMTFRIE